MNQRTSLKRKLIYGGVIVALLFPVYELSGRWLPELRKTYNLSHSSLGQIDPASETLKLATLGLRPVACSILWTKANDYKMKKNWSALRATLDQLALLEPNFVAVWRFQAWNLAYNVSVEFDDYRYRYLWVKEGMNFIRKGIDLNTTQAILVWDLGWMVSQKIGRSDEKVQFRRLFKEDDDFPENRDRAKEQRDNWLVAKEMFQKVCDLVDSSKAHIKSSALIYRSDPAKSQINYADNLEKDGHFGEAAPAAWKQAALEWNAYGDLDQPTSSGTEPVRLNDAERHAARIAERREKLHALAGDIYTRVLEEKQGSLTAEQRAALDIPADQRSPEQQRAAEQAQIILTIADDELVRRITGSTHKAADQLAAENLAEQDILDTIKSYRQIVNYDAWKLRCEVEQDPEMLAARETIYRGEQELAQGELDASLEAFDKGIGLWRHMIDKRPELKTDVVARDDVQSLTKSYRKLLRQHDLPFPENYPLQELLDPNQEE